MKVNIVTESKDWILKRCAVELFDRLSPEIEIAITRNLSWADINYFLPYTKAGSLPANKINGGFFTHYEPGTAKGDQFVRLAKEFDFCVAQSAKTLVKLAALVARDPVMINPGTDFEKQEPIFGVCGRTYKSGRKGEQLVKKMVDAGFMVEAFGSGWPIPKLNFHSSRESFYSSIDYLVITGLIEGGPMPLLEAMALNIPVIAPDVGWCWEYPVIKYDVGDWKSLHTILAGLCYVPTWERWAEKHLDLFGRLINEKS